MDNLFSIVARIIGKPEDSQEVVSLFETLGGNPVVRQRPDGYSKLFEFPDYQLGIVSHLVLGYRIIRGAFVTDVGANALEKLFSGVLPSGITTGDDRQSVQNKIGTKPTHSETNTKTSPSGQGTLQDTYFLDDVEIYFSFDAADGKMCHVMIAQRQE